MSLRIRDRNRFFANIAEAAIHEGTIDDAQRTDVRDVMYRHLRSCQAALEAGYRRDKRPNKSKRRSCERCIVKKAKCDEGTPCSRCTAAKVECHRAPNPTPTSDEEDDLNEVHFSVHYDPQTPPESTSTARSPAAPTSNAHLYQFHGPFPSESVTSMPPWPFDWGLFDANFGTINPLPDTDEVFGEIFQQLTYPKMGSVEVDISTGIIADPTVDSYVTSWNPMLVALDKIDPLETHRFTINQHLLRSGTISREDIEWLSPQNVREFICCYFRHFHRHAPLLHLPTWDIATTPSSQLLAMILLGAVYSDDRAKDRPHACRILPEAVTLTYAQDHVYLQAFQANIRALRMELTRGSSLFKLYTFSAAYQRFTPIWMNVEGSAKSILTLLNWFGIRGYFLLCLAAERMISTSHGRNGSMKRNGDG